MYARVLTAFLSVSICSLVTAARFDLDIDIPYTIHTLENGLTLIVHEDHKAPIVAVNIWYHVGSKNEQPGKTGFAHLFEHLMFAGSENYTGDYHQAIEKAGATTMNGTTNWDRTNYFQNVPTSALDLTLWLESDRMGHLLGGITQELLDEQRGIVKNEKRERIDNRPYGQAGVLQYQSIYPGNHPYSWLTIGSMEDLDAATLEDVHAWFKKHYGAANATIALAGDITPEEAIKKVEHYFGDIPSGPPQTRQSSWVAKLTGTHKQVSYDRVPQIMILKSWNIPGEGSETADYLNIMGAVMSSGKNSRLYKRLVYEDQTVTSISAYTSTGEIAGTFEITAYLKPGVDSAVVNKAIAEEMTRFLEWGPTEKELERVKIQTIAGFVRGMETIGGFGGKSDILISNYVFHGDPHFYKMQLDRIKNVTSRDIVGAAREWLTDGMYELEIRPFPDYKSAVSGADRSQMPDVAKMEGARLDDFERKTLANGLKIIVAERHAIPVVQFRLLLDAGYASDQFAVPGVAGLAMNMLDEGTTRMDSLEINDVLTMLGATLSSGSNLDTSTVSLSTLTTTLDEALAIYTDVVLNPSFPEAELNRLRQQQLNRIRREQTSARSMGLRVFPKLVYGEGHAYSNPLTGSGTLESVSAITLQQLKDFHTTWFKPNHATLVITGDTTMAEIAPKIEKVFGHWQAGEIPQKNISQVKLRDKTQLYLVDRPGAAQSFIFGTHVIIPKANPEEVAIQVMNDILGGSSNSRINMNLREDKHWSYGAYSGILSARGQRAFYVMASVQTDKTKESIQEAMKELHAYISTQPPTAAEVAVKKVSLSQSLAGQWETAGAVAGSISQIVQYGLEDDYYQTYAGRIDNLSQEEVNAVARKLIKPNNMVWVVVGDRAKVEAGLNELGYGDAILIDADGNLVE
ncbi:MAG: pitrilysin family protein [Gammaproteobacteria bacterium]|nr:pitrilysin family protein [Gammaproteobacteria bacterium]